MADIRLSDAIQFQASTVERPEARFVLKSGVTQKDVDDLLSMVARSTNKDDHIALGAAIIPPIEQVVPYVEMFDIFLKTVFYGDLEDNRIPVEKDVIGMSWQTHASGEVLFTQPGYLWTRPDFIEWDTGIEINWRTLRKAGWPVLERALRRAAEALARDRDAQKQTAIDTAVTALAGHAQTVSGGALTKSSVDTIIQDAAEIGFPITTALVNPGRFMDMAVAAGWTWGSTGFRLPERIGEQLVTKLFFDGYGGIRWYMSPHASTSYVYFGGPPSETGYHQQRGQLTSASDVDIVRKVDLHTIMDAEHAVYIGNSYRLWRLQITA
jgi:hypothetical protein